MIVIRVVEDADAKSVNSLSSEAVHLAGKGKCDMKRMMVAFVLALSACCVPCFGQHSGWYPDFEEARRVAQETQQPLLIHFKSPYCGPCLQMDRQVLHDPNVTRILNDGLVCVVVDISRREDLASRYGVETIPRDVAVMADGRVRTLNIGKLSVLQYAELLRRLSKDGSVLRNELVRQQQAIAQAEITDAIDAAEAYEQDPVAASPLIGLEGYCPVQLHSSRQWVAGDGSIAEQYRGIQYHFSNEEARAEFVSNPSRYAPQNLCCDPVVLLSAQKAVTGSIRFGAFFDNQLYLFSSLDNKNEFKKSPLRFTQIRQAVRADQIVGTRFQ